MWCDTLKSETWWEEDSNSPRADTEGTRLNTPNMKGESTEGEIAIKLKYDDRYQYVIIDKYSVFDKYSVSDLMTTAYDAFPEIEDREISHFSWKTDTPGIVETVESDLELKVAIKTMIEWERPVIRLEVLCTQDQTHGNNSTVGENGLQKL